jgi:hypothetical protein
MNPMQECVIGPIEFQHRGGVSRVWATVDGLPVWFESASAVLSPSAEAFASAFLIPALQHRVPLRIHARLSPTWRQNVRQLLGIFHNWWDYPDALPIVSDGEAELPAKRPESGQCFSGGADSFFSLLRGKHATDYLVFVHGFDISYRDAFRMRKYRPSLTAVAEAVGRPALIVRSNLRKHPLFASVSWERTHGGALAAIGHLLSPVMGSLVIPSSYTYNDPHPCGSHWTTDPLWSTENMQIIHDDASLYRLDKLKTMASEPLVRHHLRVCFENLALSGNCSRCDKCVRTMIVLAVRGELQHYPVFDQRTPIPAILDGMDPVHQDVHRRYESLRQEGLPAEIEAAVLRLLNRKRPAPYAPLRRAVRKAKLALARVCL